MNRTRHFAFPATSGFQFPPNSASADVGSLAEFETHPEAEVSVPSSAPNVIRVLTENDIDNASGEHLAVKVTGTQTGLGPNRARSMFRPQNYVAGAGWAVAAGSATATAAAADLDMSATFMSAGNVYQITLTLFEVTAGSVRVQLTGGTTVSGVTRTVNGTYTDTLTVASGNNNVRIDAVTAFTGRVILEMHQVLAMPDEAVVNTNTVTALTYLRVPAIIDPVKHCGARGDDDPDYMDSETVALQHAIDWAHAKGVPVHLGPRSYAVNARDNPAGFPSTQMKSALWVFPGVHLIGIKGRTWLKNYQANWHSLLQVRGGNDIVIDGIGLDGQIANYPGATDDDTSQGDGLLIWNTGSDTPLERIQVQNLIIQNTGHYGIGGQSSEMIGGYFHNIYMRNIGGDGFDMKNYDIYEKQLYIDGMFFEDGCGHNGTVHEDNQACIDGGGNMVLISNVQINGLDSYDGSLGNCGIRGRPIDTALGRLGSERISITNSRIVCTKLPGEGSGSVKRIIGIQIGDEGAYVGNVQVVGAYRAFLISGLPGNDAKTALVGCRAVNASGAGTADTDGVGFMFGSDSKECSMVACEAKNCNVGMNIVGANHSIDFLAKDCTTGIVATDATAHTVSWPSLRFVNCATEMTTTSFSPLGAPSAILPTSLAVMRTRRAFVDLCSTAQDDAWTGEDAILGGLRALSLDPSGPGAGLRAAGYAEMANSAGSSGTRWRFTATNAVGEVDSLVMSGHVVAAQLPLTLPLYTVATLPAVGGLGFATAFVSDSNATLAAGHGNIVAGGGANLVPVYADGTNWRIG